MLSLTVLGSGSSGNCAVIRTDRTRLLIDAGLSGRQIMLRLEAVGMKLEDLDGVLLTHEHCDHTAGLEILCRKHQVPLFATPLTQEALQQGTFRKASPRWKLMQTGAPFDFQDLRIECFPVPHDAADPVGFVITDEESRLGVLSDVGFVTNLIRDRLRGAHTLFVEANYDGPLLEADTKRPWATKQRISGRHGHLSNEQTAELLQALAHEDLHHVVLGHLSDDCNCPDIALKKMTAVLRSAGAMDTNVVCAKRSVPLPWMEVARRRVMHSLPAAVAPTAPVSATPEVEPFPSEVNVVAEVEDTYRAFSTSVPNAPTAPQRRKQLSHRREEQPDFWLDTGVA
ncbi:phosphoribosyl 1,2-cyclic phosphodiesterase [Roseimicrobium gellanilyticum]|uniref:Phosphoribosyl 1,2-cyclic phosphodiesterase n=1 Tax=Roseimicrobium gellanilyticum TaxID=748857 RepID=A0A366H3F1_9BACT|nr:MBL fold metallo-hydrolase [Roseimicrobium gellanilyticum]RBP36372.1 phosphoribosyl 1,2-cyclic phosphodiesterase [Roseimicrobium gellanilyticum]